MKKSALAVAFAVMAMAASAQAGTEMIGRVTLSTPRIGPEQMPYVESLLALANRAGGGIEIHHHPRSTAQAVLLEDWFVDHGFRVVKTRVNPDLPVGSLMVYSVDGQGSSALPAPRTPVAVPSQTPAAYSWATGERVSDLVRRWGRTEVSVVMDAVVRSSGQFDAASGQDAIARLSQATGCGIALNAKPVTVDCSLAGRPARTP